MRKGWVGSALIATGATLASTLGNSFVVVGFALIFVGTLVLAVAIEPLVAATPRAGAAPDGSDVEASAERLAA